MQLIHTHFPSGKAEDTDVFKCHSQTCREWAPERQSTYLALFRWLPR